MVRTTTASALQPGAALRSTRGEPHPGFGRGNAGSALNIGTDSAFALDRAGGPGSGCK